MTVQLLVLLLLSPFSQGEATHKYKDIHNILYSCNYNTQPIIIKVILYFFQPILKVLNFHNTFKRFIDSCFWRFHTNQPQDIYNWRLHGKKGTCHRFLLRTCAFFSREVFNYIYMYIYFFKLSYLQLLKTDVKSTLDLPNDNRQNSTIYQAYFKCYLDLIKRRET